MTLFIDSTRFVKPIKQGGWNKGETWFSYFVYSLRDIKKTFRNGYSLRDCLNDVFAYGSNGPGQTYSRQANVRLYKGKLIVGQHSGIDI